jgi:hypothetical protein
VLAKHTKHLSLVDVLSIGIDRIQRNFEPMKKQGEAWKAARIPDEALQTRSNCKRLQDLEIG